MNPWLVDPLLDTSMVKRNTLYLVCCIRLYRDLVSDPQVSLVQLPVFDFLSCSLAHVNLRYCCPAFIHFCMYFNWFSCLDSSNNLYATESLTSGRPLGVFNWFYIWERFFNIFIIYRYGTCFNWPTLGSVLPAPILVLLSDGTLFMPQLDVISHITITQLQVLSPHQIEIHSGVQSVRHCQRCL